MKQVLVSELTADSCELCGGAQWHNFTFALHDHVMNWLMRKIRETTLGFENIYVGVRLITQWDDLIAEQAPRLLAAAEFAASILGGARSNTDPLLCNGRAGGVLVALAPTFEIAHANFARLGLDDKLTRAHLAQNVRPHYASSGEFYICGPWETISHGLPL
jgi:hypothetical protein